MQRVERHIIKNNKRIDELCFWSKNLYNLANYYIRQEFIKNGTWLRYAETYKLLKNTEDFKKLPASSSQQVLINLDRAWISFFRAIKVYKREKNKFLGRPKLPGYKDKVQGRNLLSFTNQAAVLKGNEITFPKKTKLNPLKTNVTNVCQVRIVPQATCYVIEVIYEKEVEKVEVKEGTYLSIDLGVNNLATCVNNIGKKPFVINGRPLKSMNQYFNKKLALYQSYVGKKGTSKRIKSLTLKRNCKVADYMHKASRYIIDYCIQYKIANIVIGKNTGWKEKVNLGKINNQKFVCIPFATFIQNIQYKAVDVGIKVLVNEESYTSKCSFLDKESIEKHEEYMGKRITRGLFRSKNGTLINADVNGAYNILRKVLPISCDSLYYLCGEKHAVLQINGIEDAALHPVIVKDYKVASVIYARRSPQNLVK